MYLVTDIEADVTNYDGSSDFQCLVEYESSSEANLHIRKIDTLNSKEGWSDNISVLVNDQYGDSKIISVGSQENNNEKIIPNISLLNHTFQKSNNLLSESWEVSYQPYHIFEHWPRHVGREEFNNIFNSDIVHLPSSMWALGVKDGGAIVYHTKYNLQHEWNYEIKYTIGFILSGVFRRKKIKDFFCVLSALDGHIEGIYNNGEMRTQERKVKDDDCIGKQTYDYIFLKDNQYPVFYSQKYILAMSAKVDIPYCIPVVDRYYLQLNRYNKYRGIHRGIPFHLKLPKIVYAAGPRGSKYNFTKRRDITLDQRNYFASDAVDKTNVDTGSIPRETQISYKYILDIDGNASTWDATAWKINSGSVIFKTDTSWKQWFYDQFIEWEHFVPIKDDFSDLQEKYYWCESNQEKCKEIVKNCKKLFQTIYNHKNVAAYMDNVVDKLMNLKEESEKEK